MSENTIEKLFNEFEDDFYSSLDNYSDYGEFELKRSDTQDKLVNSLKDNDLKIFLKNLMK